MRMTRSGGIMVAMVVAVLVAAMVACGGPPQLLPRDSFGMGDSGGGDAPACGADGQPCCPNKGCEQGTSCNVDNICRIVCGGDWQLCCPSTTPCSGVGPTGKAEVCWPSASVCIECGSQPGAACCTSGSVCASPMRCLNGSCSL